MTHLYYSSVPLLLLLPSPPTSSSIKMHDSWRPIMRDIASWITNKPSPDQHKFGHIRGQCATAKSFVVPPLLRKALRDAGSNVPILHVMAQFKKAEVVKSRCGEDGHDIQNVDYIEATVVILEADPDYSAEFALALMTLSTAAVDGCHNIRLITMSWEGVSHMTGELFHSLGQLEVFRLPDVHDPPMCIVGQDSHGLVEWLNDLDKRIETRGMNQDAMDLPHTVLSFEVERFNWPAEWNLGWMNHENFQEITTSLHENILPQGTGRISRKRVLEPDVYTRAPTLIDAPGYFYVLPDTRRRRLLLDVRGLQVVDTPVTCSKSEIEEQLSWVHRVRVPEGYEKMIIDPPESPGEGERLLRICNDQLGGFLAALTEFSSWPRSFFTLLTTASGPSRWTHYRQMKCNLERQCLAEWADTTLGWRLSSSVDEKLFYKVLSTVGYNYEVALFVCLPSASGLVAAAKVQLASLIVSPRSYLRTLPDCLNLQKQGRLDFTYRVGLFRDHGWNSTLARALGAMKLVLAGPTSSNIDADIGSLDLGEYAEHIKRVQAKCKLLIDAFKDAHIPILDAAGFSCGEPPLALEQYDEVLFHLGRSFVHQTTFTTWDYDTKIYTTQNPFNLRKSVFPQWIMDLHPWAQSTTEQPYKGILGVYTRITCVDEESPLAIMDLTCLPARVVDRLNEYLRSQD